MTVGIKTTHLLHEPVVERAAIGHEHGERDIIIVEVHIRYELIIRIQTFNHTSVVARIISGTHFFPHNMHGLIPNEKV